MKNILLVLSLIFLIFSISCKKNPTDSTKNTIPIALFNVTPTSGTTSTTFTFDASGSTDIEDASSTLEVRWDWENDGTWDTNYSTTKTITHNYGTVGTYTIKLEVKDSGGLSQSTTRAVIVSIDNTAPTASFTVDQTSGEPGTTFTFDASGSTDNEDATSALEVRWDWENDGTYDTNYSRTKIETHQYNTIGTPTIMLEVKDNGGLTNTSTKSIQIQQELTVVTFQDANFESLIREVLYKQNGDITDADMLTITSIDGNTRGISNISGIEYCLNLIELFLNDNQIVDISALGSLTNLEGLNLSENEIINISSLNGLINLDWLWIAYNQITDIGELSGLSNLLALDIDYNQIIDINALSGITNLLSLDINNNQINDISALSGLINLKWLDLDDNQITDIGPISGLTNLEGLDLETNRVTDISALSNLTSLEELSLEDNQVSDISTLSNLTNLTGLAIDENQIIDISVLSGLINLEWLDIDENQLVDISALSGLTNLEWLDLWGNQLVDISALSSLTNLEELYLDYNKIVDISALTSLVNLIYLDLEGNLISNINSLVQNNGINNGDEVWLSYNPLSSTSLNTYIPQLQARGVTVNYGNGKIATKKIHSHEFDIEGNIHNDIIR